MTSLEYAGLNWRLEGIVASRRDVSLSGQAPPMYTLCLHFIDTVTGEAKDEWVSCDYEVLHNLAVTMTDAVNALRSPVYRRLHKLVK